jgi:small subunit ribosomal protein S16
VIKLRLKRMGAKGRPSYRIVAADSKSPRDGRFIESVGYYDPITEPTTISVNAERARYWLSVGAQPSDPVRSLFKRTGLMDKDGKVVPAAETAEPAAAPTA